MKLFDMILPPIIPPVSLSDMYGPEHYEITVEVGMVVAENPDSPGQFLIKDTLPLQMIWTNKNRKTNGKIISQVEKRQHSRNLADDTMQITLPYDGPQFRGPTAR